MAAAAAAATIGITSSMPFSFSYRSPSPVPMASLDHRLEAAAKQTVDFFVKDGMLLGLGTGPASRAAISYVGQKLRTDALREIVGVPMSSFSASEAAKSGLPLRSFEDDLKLDFAFDDADMIQEGTLFGIVGQRGTEGRESIMKEKEIARAANQFVFIVDESRFKQQLTGAVPVLIQQSLPVQLSPQRPEDHGIDLIPGSSPSNKPLYRVNATQQEEIINKENWLETAEEIDDLFLGVAEVWRRPSFGEAGPLGGDFPLITSGGHFVLDVIFTMPIASPVDVARSLELIDGVVGHGLVLDTAYAAAVASADGVKIRTSLFRSAFTSMDYGD